MTMDRQYAEYTIYVEHLADILPEAMAMWIDHWKEQDEDALRGVEFRPAVNVFLKKERAGVFTHITVRKGQELVGHFGLKLGLNLQTSQPVAGDEYFYIKPEHRKGMLGIKLIKFARDYAFNVLGAEEFTLSYRISVDDLDPVMRRCGMHKIANVYTIRRAP